MTIREYFRHIVSVLQPAVGTEAEAAARIIFEDVAGYSRTFIFVNGDREVTDFMQKRIREVVDKVIGGTPVQYATGKARFMGMDFVVSPAVLIPRPETEGLVDLITDDYNGRSGLKVLDVCTGSGCIAVALARALPFADVKAVDISDAALDIARENARALKARVDFEKEDALAMKAPAAVYDIIVSNPPYVGESEKKDMESRVLDYEPALALFVPDDDPLRFYRAIGTYAMKALMPGGQLYFEINPLHADALKSLLEVIGFEDCQLIRDYRGAVRFARAVLPSGQ